MAVYQMEAEGVQKDPGKLMWFAMIVSIAKWEQINKEKVDSVITQEIQPTFLRDQWCLIAITNRNNPSLSFIRVFTISQFTIPESSNFIYSPLSSHRNKDIRLWSRI